MKLEQQVCSLELAQKLKELNVKQESLYYWVKGTNGWFITTESMVSMRPTEYGECSAFTCGELGEMLPATIDNKYGDCTMWYNSRRTIKYHVWYENRRPEERIIFSADTEADARAKMLVYLLENKLITL